MKCILFALFLLLVACSSKKNPKPNQPLSECYQGDVVKCFEEGLNARENKDIKAARDYFKKGCEFHHAFSCSEQGSMERKLGNMEDYESLQNKACESMDAIACYNLACAHCLKNDQTKTLEALNKASSLGYSQYELAAKDPDLKCLNNNKEFKLWLHKVQKNKANLFSPSYEFSYLSGLDFSLKFPPSFRITKTFPTLFTYEDKAQISIYLSPDSYETCLLKLKKALSEKVGVTHISEKDFIRNGKKAHIRRNKFILERKNYNEILMITGDHRRCWVADGVSDETFSDKLQDEIDVTVSSLVTKDFNQSQGDDFGVSLNSDKVKFAGVSFAGQGAGFYTYYSGDGFWNSKIKSTSIFLGYFLSAKLEDEPLFRQILGDVALKLMPYGYKYLEFLESNTKLIDGKLAIYYKSRAMHEKEEVIITNVFYQHSENRLPIVLVHFQPKGKNDLLSWEKALNNIVIK